jgi:cytidyltransferase-like protein
MKTHSGIIRDLISNAYTIQLLEGSFTPARVAQKAGLSYGYCSNLIKKLHSLGLVRRIRDKQPIGSGGRSCLKGFSPAVYALTSRGRRLIKVVLAGGVFDIIHPGHVLILTESKKLGDVLVVVVARDSFIKKRKRRMPVNNERNRLAVVASLRPVDAAILGEKGYLRTIRRVMPDIISLGHDQNQDLQYSRRLVRENKLRIRIIQSGKQLPGFSSSGIQRRIKAR